MTGHQLHTHIDTWHGLGRDAWDIVHHPVRRFVPERYARWSWALHAAGMVAWIAVAV